MRTNRTPDEWVDWCLVKNSSKSETNSPLPERRFPPWSVEDQGVSNKQMWPYYINMH
jgi:hypothetical protein